jgi:methyl-accepting chemotaxis protein
MLQNMKLGSRIWFGFGTLIGITAVLGVVAVVSMNGVRTDSNMLSDEYVPEVLVANDIERDSLTTMYNVRGYQYTGDEKTFLEPARKMLADVEKGLKEAEDLAAKSPHLVKLKENVPLAQKNVATYKSLLEETVQIQTKLDEGAKAMDTAAGEFMKSAYEYLENMTQKMHEHIKKGDGKAKIEDRFWKITTINDVIDLGNAVRLARLKSEATRDLSFTEKAMPNFEKMGKLLNELKEKSVDPANKAEIERTRLAGESYRTHMAEDMQLRTKLAEVSKKRGESANEVLTAAKNTSVAGAQETKKIATNAAVSLGAATIVLIIGLLTAVALGVFIAIAITRSITMALTEISNRLSDASGQVRNAAEQLSSAAQQLASSSAEQASSIEETTASLEEMGGMVSNNVDNATHAAELSEKVSTISERGNESMGRMQESMKEILSSNEKIEALVKVIAEIGAKTQVMDEIVFQTKLLSFNASVEAERAGEHGRGFAVVAQEVGNLAQMSGKAAQEIAQIVTESIRSAETITTENKKKVETGATLVSETGSALKEILQSARSVSSGATQVLDASKEQASGIKQVNVAMSNLEKATQENASLAEEVASTSEELSAQTDMLNASVLNLDELINGAGNRGAQGAPRAEAHGEGKHEGNHHAAPKAAKKKPALKAVSSHHGEHKESAAHEPKKGDDAWESL